MSVRGALVQMGPHKIDRDKWDWDEIGRNPFFCPDKDKAAFFEGYLDRIRKDGSSIGAVIEVVAEGVPAGLGAPIYAKLDADLAAALMSINAVKGVEIGAGFASVSQRGTTHGDSPTPRGFRTNNAGGVLGGISSGQDLEVSIAVKPTSSIITPRETINVKGEAAEVVTKGRHDPCVGIRAIPIAEAMLALVVMDHALRHRAQNADVDPSVAPIAASFL
jgi:chorismate synthase